MKRKLNKYEKRIMLNLHIITFLCVLCGVLNMVLPAIENPKFTIFMLTQVFAVGGIHVFSWINSRNLQRVPIAMAFIVRSLQALIFVFWRADISWTTFGVLIFLDILLMVLLALDKANYQYVYVKREDDEFVDK